LREFLRTVLASLQVPPVPSPSAGDTVTDLDGVCDALANERRFRIQGVLGEVKQPGATPLGFLTRSPIVSRFGADRTLGAGRSTLQLLGSKIPDATDAGRVSSYFYIEIRRMAENAFDVSVKERSVN
jgi:hypothetical protein